MRQQQVSVKASNVKLAGDLAMPDDSLGFIIFAHGSGSSRRSPRNQEVARTLQEMRLGTLLFDLLTAEEEQAEAFTRHFRFNIHLLAERLIVATRWALDQGISRDLPTGLFGASTGAAAALVAASRLGGTIAAVVSRGGRPDLAGDALPQVGAPTLLIIGQKDTEVLRLNEQAYETLTCEKALRTVPGASHLFEEPGALEIVAAMSAEWFNNHLHPMQRT